jgi:L-asparaginase
MATVRVLTTGGTIATRTGADGNAIARAGGQELVEGLMLADIGVEVEDVFRIGSFRMTLERLHTLAKRVMRNLHTAGVAGVVVTHGTDTLEETAFFLDLFLEPTRPVVLTGAQSTADSVGADGPRNIRDAIIVAAEESVVGRGVLIVFDGAVFPARGTHKLHTIAATAFGSSLAGEIGWVHANHFNNAQPTSAPPRLPIDDFDPHQARVDIVPCYPDADDTAMVALVEAGARGIVLEGVGAGNANPVLCAAVRDAVEQGVVVATSTRVASGPVLSIYADGGGADLRRAGALPMGAMRPSHARILLSALLGVHGDAGIVRREAVRYLY